jgi:osmoprotectant transport system substrate-binding protein
MAALALCCAGFAASAQSRDKVVVASKIDTEGALLGHMVLIALEKAGVPVENRLQLGPTKIVRTALVSGEIDLYPEYTGNGAFFFNKEDDPAWKQAQSGYDLVKSSTRRRTSSSGSTGRRRTTPGSSPSAAT